MGAVLLTGFGALALLLASLGIGGVVSYTVQRRRRDIGIRMALGAARSSVTTQVAMDMALPVVLGTAAGLMAASLLTRSVEGFLFGVSATDPATYAAISGFLLAVALVAAAVPARRATAVNPVEVLGAE
jgi:ABC-type antimicrobial peptide transport system permease subunit